MRHHYVLYYLIMKKNNQTQISKELKLYFLLSSGQDYSAKELMNEADISNRRTYERYLDDIRNSGLLSIKWDRKHNNYSCGFDRIDKTLPDKKKAHLMRLIRLANFVNQLEPTELPDLIDYYDDMIENEEFLETLKERDPKAVYYRLYPAGNEKTRQRDFEEIRRAGHTIHYSKKLGVFLFIVMYLSDGLIPPDEKINTDKL